MSNLHNIISVFSFLRVWLLLEQDKRKVDLSIDKSSCSDHKTSRLYFKDSDMSEQTQLKIRRMHIIEDLLIMALVFSMGIKK